MKEERRALKDFRADYREARERLRAGTGKVEFPEGTYRLRLLGLRCAAGCATPVATRRAPKAKKAARARATKAKRAA